MSRKKSRNPDEQPVREEKTEQKEQKGKTGMIRELLPYAIMLVIVLLIRVIFLINASIPTESMENTIPRQTRVMGLKSSYWFAEPQRGDIIVFDAPDEPGTPYVKRIIGVAGDTVEVTGGVVYLNGEILSEPYLKEEMEAYGYTPGDEDFGPEIVPEGCYFCMGDNRNASYDARFWENTWVTDEAIVGKVYFCYWPRPKWIDGTDGDTFSGFE